MKTTHKYLAHFIIEADTPFAIGSGEKGFTVDRLIVRNALGLPYILGTSLAGLLRHELDPSNQSEDIQKLFGFQDKNSEEGQGSRLVVSNGHLIGEDGNTVIEGLASIDTSSGYYSYFFKLPERDHVRINERGTAEKHAKFDEELVYKGTRFAFRLELSGDDSDKEQWNNIIRAIHHPLFRLGAGTRKGFGKLKVISCKTRVLNLEDKASLMKYLTLSSSLNEQQLLVEGSTVNETIEPSDKWIHYQLNLKPKDFYLFAAGYGDEEVDDKPKTERYFEWTTGRPVLLEKDWLLIPATSIKGALSHRVAFHYNMLENLYIYPENLSINPLPKFDFASFFNKSGNIIDFDDLKECKSNDPKWEAYKKIINEWKLDDEAIIQSDEWKQFEKELEDYKCNNQYSLKKMVGEQNLAVKTLFGNALDNDDSGSRGNVVISDVYIEPTENSYKILSHVAIDKFTGGSRDGMLFQQKVAASDRFVLDIFVNKEVLNSDNNIKTAFESSLNDLCTGNLPLGGGTNKGHGVFLGTINQQ